MLLKFGVLYIMIIVTIRTKDHFAYPNGGSLAHVDDKSKALVREAGFQSATTSKEGKPGFESDLFELRRMRSTEALSEMLWDI